MSVSQSRPALRGDALREHILRTAKDVFLEMGFERTSMDVVAARAATSKRTVYSHFGSKDSLFLAVADFTRELYLRRLAGPETFSDDPQEAVTLFCGRFLEFLLWESVVRTCRLFIAEAERLPAAAARSYAAIFTATEECLAEFLVSSCQQSENVAVRTSTALLAQAVYPRAIKALFGVDLPRGESPETGDVAGDLDLESIRAEVARLL